MRFGLRENAKFLSACVLGEHHLGYKLSFKRNLRGTMATVKIPPYVQVWSMNF